MERSILLAKNPWWKKEHFKEGEDYKKWEEKKIKWIPEIIKDIKLSLYLFFFLY